MRTIWLIVLVVFVSGCAWFPPAHPNSLYDKGEKVKVVMLPEDKFSRALKKDWDCAFKDISAESQGCNVRTVNKEGYLETAVGVITPVVVNYVGKQVEKAATYHEQQFAGDRFSRDFWTKIKGGFDGKKLTYKGFRISRSAKSHNEKEEDSACYDMVYGMARDAEGYVWIAPLSVTINKSKAKVSKWGGDKQIESTIDLAFDAAWVDPKGHFHKETVADIPPLTIKHYGIDTPVPFRQFCSDDDITDGTCKRLEGGREAFSGIPISALVKGVAQPKVNDTMGTFWVKAQITERDESKAKEQLTSLSQTIKDNKDKVVEWAVGEVTEEETPAAQSEPETKDQGEGAIDNSVAAND